MLDPETLALAQSFAYGIAQNLISSAIVEWKQLKDDRNASKNSEWLGDVVHSKPIEERIVQAVCGALRKLDVVKEQFQILLPLASDPIFGAELAREILFDRYSSDTVASIILRCSPSAESLGGELTRLTSLLMTALQSVIADDPHLHRTKELRFQANITAAIAEIKDELSTTNDTVRETGQIVVAALGKQFEKILADHKMFSDKTGEPEIRERIYHDRVEQARKLLESGKTKTAWQLLHSHPIAVGKRAKRFISRGIRVWHPKRTLGVFEV